MTNTQQPLSIQQSKVGDVLEDGSIVLIKGDNHAIVVSSEGFSSDWYDMFYEAKAFAGPEWFVPSKELLLLAYKTIPEHFGVLCYWSSSVSKGGYAYNVDFSDGLAGTINKRCYSSVRPFRCIIY